MQQIATAGWTGISRQCTFGNELDALALMAASRSKYKKGYLVEELPLQRGHEIQSSCGTRTVVAEVALE